MFRQALFYAQAVERENDCGLRLRYLASLEVTTGPADAIRR
jgi:hypothetical protein